MWHGIINMNPTFPAGFSTQMQDFVKRLLNKDPHARLGCIPDEGGREIMEHPWFASVNFNALMSSNPPEPPFKPDVKGETDTKYVSREIVNQPAKDSIVNASSASKRQAAEADFGNFDFNEEVDATD